MTRSADRIARWRSSVVPALNLVLFGLALLALDHVLRQYAYRDIVAALHAISLSLILLAAAMTALGYLALVGYDYVAFRFLGRPIPIRRMLFRSFVSFAVSNNAPASLVTAGGVRYRLYRSLGLTVGDAAVVAGFNAITYALGLCALAGVVLLLRDAGGPGAPGVTFSRLMLGGLLVAAAAAYLLVARLHRGSVRFLGRTLRLPALRFAAAQLGVSAADWLASSGALYVLLSGVTTVPYLAFLTAFLAAQFAALLLPIPGGLGVFEALVLLLLPSGVSAPSALAALLLYRVVYYLFPLVAAGIVLAIRAGERVRRSDRPLRALLEGASSLAPRVLAMTTFLSGGLLLVSGAIPTDDRRLAWLAELLPLSVIEASHFLSSIVGAVLVVFAWGLERRVRLAYHVVRALFGAGILLTLLRSFDLRLSAVLTLSLGILLLAGRDFPRSVSLAREPMGSPWIFAVGALLLADIWLGLLIYRHVQLAGEVWWRFALFGHGPRALRAVVGGSVVILLYALARLLSRSAPEPPSTEARTND